MVYEFRSEVKMQHIEAWANTNATVSRRNHEPQYANGKTSWNESSVAEFLTEKAKVPGVNHTSRKCCFVHRWLIVVGKTRKSKQSEAFRATRGFCVTERIVVLFDRYRRQSIKATTRGRRSKSMAQIVGRVRREVPLKVFPAPGEKKRI